MGFETPITIEKVIQVIQENNNGFPYEEILEELKGKPKSMKFDTAELDGLLTLRYDKSYTFSVLSVLYPWLKFDQQFHVDHIFPRGMFNTKVLKKHNIPEENWHLWLDHYNDLANLQLLQGPDNLFKSDEPFESWIKKECPTPTALAAYKQNHLIPDVSFRFEDFPKFLEEREKLIREKLAEIFGVRLEN